MTGVSSSPGAGVFGQPRRRSLAQAWGQLLRPHFITMSLGGGLAGMAIGADGGTVASIALGVTMCITGYPFGVIVNDYLDRKADAINAPDRPLVTGEIAPSTALAVVGIGTAIQLIAAAIIAPAVLVWSVIGIVGHALYGMAKGIPMLGNLVNGEMAVFVVIGSAAAAPDRSWLDVPGPVWAATAIVAVTLAGFCLVGYFKDVPGDAAAGYRTLPVVLGPDAAKWWTIPFPVAAIVAACVLVATDADTLGGDANAAFWVLIALSAAALALGIRNLLTDPRGHAYDALALYTRGTVLLILALGAVAEPVLFAVAAVPFLVFLEATLRQTEGTGQV